MDRISYLLDRYLSNTCTRQEMDELLDHIARHPEDARLHAALQRGWETDAVSGERQSGGLVRDHTPGVVRSKVKVIPSHAGWWKVAACFVFVAVCVAIFPNWPRNVSSPLADRHSRKERKIDTASDEHRMIVLADGSSVWLSGNSSVTCDASFNDEFRRVTLEGEAFFDIRHDANRPFIITSGVVRTTVLGTAFNIRAFPGEKAVTVTVKRGSVRVESERKRAQTITANQQVKLDLETEQFEERAVDAVEVTQWISGDLILDEVTLGDVQGLLEDRYSVVIQFDNSKVKDCRFTSTFFGDASLDEVMTAICLVNGASYDLHDNIITIYGSGCDDNTSDQ